uniref:Proteasome assembly chaperone 1 n=1 Tax=Alexandrium catenella TaxID=2925 RepID=A0A7S1WFC6_ALECA
MAMIGGLLDQIQPDASDEEDDEEPDIDFAFEANGAGEAASSCRAVVVCNPGAATAFALGTLSLEPVAWKLDFVKERPLRAFPPPPKPPRFYLARGSNGATVAVAVLEGPIPADLASAWAEALLKGFSADAEVLFLDRVFRAGFCVHGHEERPVEPHLCGLWTAAWGGEGPHSLGSLARFMAPNVIEGLGAALLTQCEAERRRCLVALTLQDGAHLGISCVRAFSGLAPLLQDIGLLPSDWSPPDYAEVVRQVVPPPSMAIYA